MISITRYRVWPDGAVQEADTPAHHWKSDDYELVEAPTPEDAWARAKANAPMVPELNYAALCDAAFLQDKRWVQGTTGCVAFTLGAEWYRDQLLAKGPHTLYKTNDPEAPATIRDRNGEVVLSMCKVCGKAEVELGEPCHAPAVPQGYEIHEIPADYSGLVWLEGQVRAVARLAQAATGPQGWTDADSDAARLALELECLLMDTKDLSVVSKWWASANDALELHRQRLGATPAPAPAQEVGLTDGEPAYGAGLLEQRRELDAIEFFESTNRDSYEFKKSVRGIYANPAVARDWKWFQLGMKHATEDES